MLTLMLYIVYVSISLGFMPRSRIANSYNKSNVNSFKNGWAAFKAAVPSYSLSSYFLTSVYERFKLSKSTVLLVIACLISFACSHSGGGEVVSHCDFCFHFSDGYWCWASFWVFLSHFYIFLAMQIFCLF